MKLNKIRDGSHYTLISSALLLYGSFTLLYFTGKGLRYNRGPFEVLSMLMAFGFPWSLWAIHLLLIKQGKLPSLLTKFITTTAIFALSLLSSMAIARFAGPMQPDEFNQAIHAGLKKDCLRLAEGLPTEVDHIYQNNAQFESLPASIKILSPSYIERRTLDDTNGNSCIMICRNGFAGFSGGIIVFKTEGDFKKFKERYPSTEECPTSYEQLASCIYYLWALN